MGVTQEGTATATDQHGGAGTNTALYGAAGISTFPAGAAAANGVSIAEVIRHIDESLSGTVGLPSFPAAAAPANDVSLAEVLRANYLLLAPQVDSGTSDIDDSVQDESAGWVVLTTIAPAAGAPIRDCRVIYDLAKATTGFAAVESTATIQFRVARKVDGTNWRGDTRSETTAISGTNAAGHSLEIVVGDIGVTEQARIEFKMSADATADMELPDNVIYHAIAAPTITRVAAA